MAIRIPPPKTPQDDTLLTTARAAADEWYQQLPPSPGPKWHVWLNLPEVQLWEAVALTCGIEPEYYLGDANREFADRMRIAIGNGLGKGDRPHCTMVTLKDVARLARHCGWTLPPEFPGANPLEHAQDPNPPNWDRWLYVPSIELGHAIALSLNIDPKCLSSGRHLIPDTFVTRLQVAIEHLRPGGVLSDFSGEARENSIVVTLQAVARLANFCRWTLPPEFPKPERVPAGADAEPVPEEVKHSDDEMAATPAAEQPARADDGARALSKAEEILAKERGKPRDIAWAWTVLMDHRQGVAPEHNERRFRQILERHRWILALPALTTDERGCPTRQYGGTPVSGIDRNADPEERLFMRVIDVRGEAIRQGLVWPDEPSAPAGGVAKEPYQSALVDVVPTARSNPLTSVITKARSSALNAEDPSSVWAELVKMAESPNRPGPLIGYAEGEGIKYQTEKGVQFLTRKNFGDREMRVRKRASAR